MKYIVLIAVVMMLISCKGKPEQQDTQAVATPENVQSITEESPTPNDEPMNQATQATPASKDKPAQEPKATPAPKESYKVTFLEIGSVNCIPCRMMQPIMKEIAEEFKGIVKVEFHDLGVDREIGPKYNIRVMPTQVFLDEKGKEFFRHEGFYPKEELAKMLDAHLSKASK